MHPSEWRLQFYSKVRDQVLSPAAVPASDRYTSRLFATQYLTDCLCFLVKNVVIASCQGAVIPERSQQPPADRKEPAEGQNEKAQPSMS